MKDQLLKWGFGEKTAAGFYRLDKGIKGITVRVIDENIHTVKVHILGCTADVPNCNTKLALFTFLYNLGLIEI